MAVRAQATRAFSDAAPATVMTLNFSLPHANISKSEIDRQSIIQMCGLVAEYRRYGKATVGFRFFRELDDQLDLSQTYIGRAAKQIQARFGITMAYQLLDQHPFAFEQVVEALKAGKTPVECIAIFESAVTPEGWTDTKFVPPSATVSDP